MVDINRFKGDGDVLEMNPLGASAELASFNYTCTGASADNAGSAANGTYWTFSTDRHDYYVWYNITGTASSGTVLSVADPVPSDGDVGIPVTMNVSSIQHSSQIVLATVAQLEKLSELTVTSSALGFRGTMVVHGAVDVAVADDVAGISSSVFIVSLSNVVGVARATVAAKFVIHTAASGLVEAVIGEDGVVYDIAGSTHRIEDYNKGFGGSRLGVQATLFGADGDDPVKTDNLVMSIGGSGAVPAFAEGSTISGVV